MYSRSALAAAALASVLFALKVSAPSAQGSLPDAEFFQTQVFPVFEAAKCSGCHTSSGVASASRLRFPDPGASPAQIKSFGLSLARLVDRADASKSPLITKPTNQVRHTGGVRIKPGSREEQLLLTWVTALASAPEDVVAAAIEALTGHEGKAQPMQLVRRLTHAQYDNTVRDLLGDYSRPAQRFPPEDYVDGFKNQLTAQSMPPLLVETYSTAAERLALNAFRAGDINGLVPCKPAAFSDAKCRDAFVRAFGLRAFRRPLTEDELKRYAMVFAQQAKVNRRFLDGARVVVEAMLQSPNFLFHVEAGPGARFTDYDVASRLSYLLWNTMPDAALFEAAAKGELRTAEGRERTARRLLEDNPRSRQAMDQFFEEWLRFDRVVNAVKQRGRHPEFTPELAAAMAEETRTLLHHLVWSDRNFMEALTADYSFLTSELASLYAVPQPEGQFEMVKFPPGIQRAGILGQGTFLASTAGPSDTSPTARGIFIRERLLCQHVPPPPPGVITTLPDPIGDQPPKGRRRLMVEHVENPTCASCHRLMDPIGFGLEHFDAIGKWRDQEAVPLPGRRGGGSGGRGGAQARVAIDAHGEIAGLPDSQFSGARDLGALLAASPTCQKCIVRQMFRYTYGRLETGADEKTIDVLYGHFKDSGFKVRSLLMALVQAPEFLRQWNSASSGRQ
jgi:hypothetical protein